MYSNLLRLINQIANVEESELEFIKESFRPLHLSKGEFFLESGKISRQVGYLNKGLDRYFVYNDGEEFTFEFTREGAFALQF